MPTWIRILKQMATLYYAEHFTLHGLRLRSLLPISVQDRNPSPNPHVSMPLAMLMSHKKHATFGGRQQVPVPNPPPPPSCPPLE